MRLAGSSQFGLFLLVTFFFLIHLLLSNKDNSLGYIRKIQNLYPIQKNLVTNQMLKFLNYVQLLRLESTNRMDIE